MTITKLYESAKDTDERISPISPSDRTLTEGKGLACILTLETTPTEFAKNHKFQGFGGALTESSAYVFSKLPKEKQEELVKAYFDPTCGNNYNLARIHMNSCDFSLENWACLPEKAENLDSFTMERTDKYITPLAQAAVKARGGNKTSANGRAAEAAVSSPAAATATSEAPTFLSFLMSPWSPPAWMKDNKDMNHGGHILPQYRRLWAQNYARFIQEMQARGVKIDYVTIQNEPAAVQVWDSCIWSATEEAYFAVNFLRPALDEAGLSNVKIFIWDHNRDIADQRFEESMTVPGAKTAVSGLAFHWYSGDQYENIKKIAEKYPQMDIMFTEGCVEGGPRNGAWFTGERYAHNIINDLKSGTTKWIDWNILLDMQGGPNHVGNYCDAPVLADPEKGQLYFQSSFYQIGHFSRFIQSGACLLETKMDSWMVPANVDGRIGNTIESLAYKNPDGSITLIVTNRTEANMVYQLKIVTEEKFLTCPPRGIQTLIIK